METEDRLEECRPNSASEGGTDANVPRGLAWTSTVSEVLTEESMVIEVRISTAMR